MPLELPKRLTRYFRDSRVYSVLDSLFRFARTSGERIRVAVVLVERKENAPLMKALLPLVFEWAAPIFGHGFLARVSANGRAVLVREDDDKWWVYGVEPGSVAEGGGTSHEASLAFFSGLGSIAHDFAAATRSFDEFKAQIESFFSTADEEEAVAWDTAFESFGEAPPRIDDAFLASLKTVPLRPSAVLVERIEQQDAYTPDLNREGDIAFPLADAA